MTISEHSFEPRWASVPGDSIQAILRQRGWTVDDLSDRLGIGDPPTRRLLTGESEITEAVATLLAQHLGGSQRFWLSRERQYRESLHAVAADELARSLPIAQMIKLGWIDKHQSWRDQALAGLEFLDVDDAAAGNRRVRDALSGSRYRSSSAHQPDPVTRAVWIRKTEIEATKLSIGEWSPARALAQVGSLRALTRVRDPEKFVPELQTVAASFGVAVVIVRPPMGAALSGAAFEAADGRKVIALTARHLSDDHFWFTLMHELGHLVLHAGEGSFVDDFDGDRLSDAADAMEREADRFAQNALWPNRESDLAGTHSPRVSKREILKVASEIGVSPGVAVGQLQHQGILQFNQLNTLKRRYRWEGSSLRTAGKR